MKPLTIFLIYSSCFFLQIVSQEVEHERLKVFIGARVADAMPLVRIDLQLVWLLRFDERIDQDLRVFEVHILVNQAVDNQKAVFAKD